MDMQKLQVRADLERMVYNYALLGKIENDTAAKIAAFIGHTIGGGNPPEIRGKIITFPVPAGAAQPAAATIAPPPPDEKEQRPPFSEWVSNFEGAGFDEYGRAGKKILLTLYERGINSLEELASTPPDAIRRRHYIGDGSLEMIRAVLEKNGFAWEPARRKTNYA